ncbi:MAG: homocysteine S-methyltransferase family protein [Oscillospiraceae bacterium]|nr:homocysteine S-methyltransferase family protein [Oscillospiraceae bacterium]
MKFKELLRTKKIIFADGAQGTELRRLSKEKVESPHLLNFSAPELVKKVMKSYAEAGADFVCANTFSINRFNVRDVEGEIAQALGIAKAALCGTPALVALDVTTTGRLLEPSGLLKFEEAYEVYKEIVTAGEKHGADLVIIETMSDLYETKAAVLAVKENTNLPVICSMTFEKHGRSFTGTPISCMAAGLEGLLCRDSDVLGVNCSLGPVELRGLVRELLDCTDFPVMLKPNAGLPDPETGEFPLSADEFAAEMAGFAEMGVKILGGCCGTTPEFIRKLRDNAEMRMQNAEISRIKAASTVVCGSTISVDLGLPGVKIIGERINPTGKKLMKQALLDNDMSYIQRQAALQINAGAAILDVNVGAVGVDEVAILPRAVKAVQAVTGAPLQIDTANPAALEAALRVVCGKAIVNSVNGDEESLKSVLPLVKKYGAAVVGLTLDKSGIPDTAEGRFALAEKILNRAIAHGIRREDVFIDCLTLTAGAEQGSAKTTLKAVAMVKERLGLKTVLGVSNVSFGLPERGIINRTFLALALQNGLDMPILNPADRDMMDTVRAFDLLSGSDVNAACFIRTAKSAESVQINAQTAEITLEYAIQNGLKTEAVEITKTLIASGLAGLDIINTKLIPALDKTGADFEKGNVFLPQLMLTAETASACFEVVKETFSQTEIQDDRKIILATVKGDIHDIGKNIVKTLLESYGFRVIDLGRDVPPEVILAEARRQNVRLVGLSALMTPTLPAMEETTRLLKAELGDGCKVMVGGAVLTADYAAKIGADFYGGDAKSAVAFASRTIDN